MSRRDCDSILSVMAQYDDNETMELALRIMGLDVWAWNGWLSSSIAGRDRWDVKMSQHLVLVFDNQEQDPDRIMTIEQVIEEYRS